MIAVGTVVGFEVGYPALGFALGSLAGSVLFPTQMPRGPQIGDNRTTTSSLGDPVAIAFGTADVAGTIIWLAPYVQTTHGGKGGQQQTTYQYNQSIAIGLCEGPIGTVTRIWENGAIVYDIRPQQQANADLGLLAETDTEYSTRLSVSAAYADTFVLYTGTETQEADPTMEAIQGYGNVPAFRGLAYIVYPNRLLQTAQAWRQPTWRFEVAASGAGACDTVPLYSQSVLYPWLPGNDPTNELNVNTFRIDNWDTDAPGNTNPGLGPPPGGVNQFSSLAAALDYLQPAVPGYTIAIGYAIYGGPGVNNITQTSNANPPYTKLNDPYTVNGVVHRTDPSFVQVHFNHTSVSDYKTNLDQYSAEFSTEGLVFWNYGAVYKMLGPWKNGDPIPPLVAPWGTVGVNPNGWPLAWYKSADTIITVMRTPAAPQPPCAGLPKWSQDTNYAVQADGSLVKCGDWVLDASDTHYYVMQLGGIQPELTSLAYSTNTTVTYPLNPVLPVASASNTALFWTTAYNAAVAAGKMPAGMTFSLTGGPNTYPTSTQALGYRVPIWLLDQTICKGTGGNANVADIITAVCTRAGLMTIDVADMASVSIPGYSVSSLSSGSAILTPLRSVAFFDAVESQGVMRFLARGKPVVATLTTDDIGAYDESGGGHKSVPPSVSTVRAQDEDLPRMIRFKYKAVSRDYQEGEQDSPFRLATQAVNDVDVSCAVCLGDSQAAQCAEVLWADAWAARTAYTVSVDQAWLALDCGDAIGVPVDGVIQRMRITTDTNASGVLRKLSCVRDDGGAYISFATVQAPLRQAQTLSFIGPSSYELLDLPALQDADSGPGFYLAAQRQSGGGMWNGVMVYQSLDGGVSYVQQFAMVHEAPYGTLLAPLPASEPYTWDTTTSIQVAVANERVTFESVTDAAVIAGANGVAIGADGRWEIVQFATATQVSSTQWTLSRLLRGRRGTEYVMGSSVTGDAVVLVSGGDLARIVLQQSQVGTALGYKVVSLGASYATGINATFAGHAQALVPFSPVALAATGQTNGDTILTWIRRGRLGRTLTSGADIPLSEATEAYQVDIYNGAAVARTLSVTAQSANYTHADQFADFGAYGLTSITVAVYQMSAIVGRGTPATATLAIGGVIWELAPPPPPPPPVTHTIVVTFGGTFDATNGMTASIFFNPPKGNAVSSVFKVSGTGKTSVEDFATDFAAQATTVCGAYATITVVGTVVTISTTAGSFANSSLYVNNFAPWVRTDRPAMAAQAGSPSWASIDLYIGSYPNIVEAPASDPAYATPGSGLIVLGVSAYDPVEQNRISRLQGYWTTYPDLRVGDFQIGQPGPQITVSYDNDSTATYSLSALAPLAAALAASPTLRPYLLSASLGQPTGLYPYSMDRPAIAITMKDGYYLSGGAPPGASLGSVNGFDARLSSLQPGTAAYPSGATKLMAVEFGAGNIDFVAGVGTNLGSMMLGQVWRVTLDGVSYTHIVNAADMADTYTAAGLTFQYLNGIYADLAAQITATGLYNVKLAQNYRDGSTTTYSTYLMQLERIAPDVDFTLTAGVDYALTLSFAVT